MRQIKLQRQFQEVDETRLRQFRAAYIVNEINGGNLRPELENAVKDVLTDYEKTLFKKLIDVADGEDNEKSNRSQINTDELRALNAIGTKILEAEVKSVDELGTTLTDFAKVVYGTEYSDEKLTELKEKLNQR
ncbi:MAG TPA: hypothetical protein DIV86_00150 [Alphaproteobacteria bacterium]|nr:hypothetical protein [Alphaproteobacteria bacterium]